MVSGINNINNFFSLGTLNQIRSELTYLPTENGNVNAETQTDLSPDTNNAIKFFGKNKVILDSKINDLISQKETPKQTSKEMSPNMDLSLDMDDIPSPPKL